MLPIYFVGDWHHKNKRGLALLKNSHPWNGEKNGVILLNHIDETIIQDYENVIVGPGIEFKHGLEFFKKYNKEKKIIANVLSPWLKNLFDMYAPNPNVTYVTLPFPVDVDRFQPSQKRNDFLCM